jgi:mRNA interferase HigB
MMALIRGSGSHKLHVISPKKLREFWGVHPQSAGPLTEWFRLAKKSEWTDFNSVRLIFGMRVDRVGENYIFDIGGNRYRLIAEINFRRRKIFVRHVMTHAEYSLGNWK